MNTPAIPTWLKPYLLETKTLSYEGVEYTYFVVKSSLSVSQGFPAQVTVYADGVLAVSAAYPEKFRELGVIHEVIHFIKHKDHGEDCCLTSLKEEIQMAKDRFGDATDYIIFREHFFNGLVQAYESIKEKSETEEMRLTQIKLSHRHLLRLCFKQ